MFASRFLSLIVAKGVIIRKSRLVWNHGNHEDLIFMGWHWLDCLKSLTVKLRECRDKIEVIC